MWISYVFTILVLVLHTCTDTAETGPCERCTHGECVSDGCSCDFCYKGDTCDEEISPADVTQPTFEESIYEVTLSRDQTFGTTILKPRTCPSADNHVIEFRFVNLGRDNEFRFDIDKYTGEIVAEPGAYMVRETVLYVVASLNGVDSDPVEVVVTSSDGAFTFDDASDDIVHSREKRAVVTELIPNEVEFYLEKTGEYQNLTEMYVGSRIHFQLSVHFPAFETDMLVELFTPDNDTNVMVLCDVQIVHCGGNLDICPTSVQPVMDSKTGDNQYDRAILDFGNVTNVNGSETVPEDSMIIIEWDAVMIPNAMTNNGSLYWVSAGAEYNNENEIWVGQASFYTITDDTPITTSPTFNMTGPETLELGTSMVITVDMYIPNPAAELNFDAFAPLNGSGAISICSAKVMAIGSNFACLLEKDTIMPQSYPYSEYPGNERVRLPIGVAINKASRDSTMVIADNLIQVEFVVSVTDDEALLGNSYWIGAALEIGTDQIWAGQYLTTIIPRTDTNNPLPYSPNVVMSTTDTQVAVGGAAIMEIEIELPEESVTEYTLDVVMPSNDSAPRFQVCHVGVTFQGTNLPCTRENSEAIFTSRFPAASNKSDYASLELGRLRNTGYFNATADPTANLIRLSVLTVALNHSLNTPGSSAYLTAGLKYNTPTELWVGQSMVFITDSGSTGTNITSSDYPEFQMNFTTMGGTSDGNVPVDGMAMVNLEITALPEVLYSPMDVEVIVPYNGGALYQLCKVEVTHVGKNLPCSDPDDIQESAEASSKDLNEIYDKFALSLGVVYNVRKPTQVLEHPDDDKIKMTIVLRVLEHTDNTLNSQEWVSAGVVFDPLKLWVGQLGLTITNVIDYTTADAPFAAVVRYDNIVNQDTNIGQSVRYSVVIKPELYSQGPIIVKASVSDTKLSICSMQLVSVGDDFGCGYNRTRFATYTPRAGEIDIYEAAEIDLGMISNVGSRNISQNETVDDASIVVDVIVHLHTTASNGDSLTVNIQLDSGANTDIVTGLDQTIDAITPVLSTSTATSTLPTYNFTLTPIRDEAVSTNVRPGEVKQFYMDIYFAENSSNYYNVKFLSPVNFTGAMEVCSVVVVSVGANLPCLRRSLYKAAGTTTTRSGSLYDEIGELDLGYVCQFPIHNDTEENKIRLLAVTRVPKHVVMPANQEMWFSGTVRINSDQIYVTQHLLTNTMLDPTSFIETSYDVNEVDMIFVDGGSTLNWRPGTINTLQLNITVPRNSALKATFDIETPVVTSAVMTVQSVTVNSASGRNLACLTKFPDLDYIVTPYSEHGTTQNNKAILDMGIITNSGVTVIDEDEMAGDDEFLVDLEIMMADSPANTANSQHNVSVVLTLGTTTVVADRFINVLRDDLEAPSLVLSANVTNDTIVYQSSAYISIQAELNHTDSSSAEGHNVTVTFYYPPYLTFDSITELNMTETSNGPSSVVLSDGSGVSFVFDHLYFTDVAIWTFRLGLVSVASDIPSGNVQDAVTPYEVYTHMIYRPNNAEPEGHFFTSQLDSLSYQVLPSIGVECSIAVLGMADGRIEDCQLSGSTNPNSAYDPTEGRNSAAYTGWQAANRGSIYKKYYQVYFGNITMVQKIHVAQPTAFTTAQVSQYTVYSSYDGYHWTQGETVVTGGTVVNTLSAPAEGRYLRIVIDSHTGADDSDVGIKVEFEGCYISADVQPSGVCQASKPWDRPDPADMYYRGYLIGGGASFFCDTDPNSEEINCYSSTDGSTWRVLDQTLMNVIAYNSATNHLYGISKDKRTYLLSVDTGNTWVSVNKAKYDAETGLLTATELPWVYTNEFRDGLTTPDTTFTDAGNQWAAHYRGMYWYTGGAWRQVTDWNKCCA